MTFRVVGADQAVAFSRIFLNTVKLPDSSVGASQLLFCENCLLVEII
jgi:hypothetical protein